MIIPGRIISSNKNIILCGDFNYDLLKISNDDHISDFFNHISSNGLIPHILQPTRFHPNQRPSLVDNIFSNHLGHDGTCGNLLVKISDHLPNFLILPGKIEKTNLHKHQIWRRDFTNFIEKDFITELHKALKSINQNETSANDLLNQFHNIFLAVLERFAPLKKTTRKQTKMILKPWLTPGILKSIKTRDNFYKKYVKTKDIFFHDRYSFYRNKIRKLIYLSKTRHYQNYFSQYQNNAKKMWTGIRDLMNKSHTPGSHFVIKKEGLQIISQQSKVTNELCKYFSTVATKLSEKIPATNKCHKDYLQNAVECSMFAKPATIEEISEIISDMSMKKANDIYGISPMILKLSSNIISPILISIFN